MTLALALAVGVLLSIRLATPAFFDNEGRYAEVAREMLLLGDWVTPHLDFAIFLNKPPLLHWLTALAFQLNGLGEGARIVSVLASMVTLVATCRLAALLYGERASLVAGVMLASTLGFVFEARTLRPDSLLTAAIVTALFCWACAETVERSRGRWLVGLYAALGIGVLAKGLVAVVIPALPIMALTLRAHGLAGIRRLKLGMGLVVLAIVVLPWHVLVALRNPGFAWDYVVNQHILFFFDKKLPHDSEGDTLAFFWTALALRASPWVLLAPLTFGEAWRGRRPDATPSERATFFAWAWVGGLMLFFSCAPSRLEHYTVPAVPGVAVLAACVWQRWEAGALGRAPAAYLGTCMAVLLTAGALILLRGRDLFGVAYWMHQAPGLLALAPFAGTAVLLMGALGALALARRRASGFVAALAVGVVPMVLIVSRAEVEAEALFSWRPVARLLADLPPDADIVFEAPEEYQLVGGLAYYTQRRITLLEPPQFVPPTYLAGHTGEMFLSRIAFERRWQSGVKLAFVSDSQRRRDDPAGLVPAPFHVLGHQGDRWVLANY
jgi:4-amino-4-deoxy-L-arabinose transferase-like glycosyltransferase